MTLSAAVKIELIETALADGKYRTLQNQLRELKNAGRITVRCYLSNSHELLKAEAQHIIESLKQIAETQDATATIEQKTDEFPTSLPTGTIVNSSNFGDRTSDTETHQDATATEAELPPKFFSLNWQTLNFDSYDKPYPDQREYKPYPKIDQLITETKMAGRYGLTALLHPSNHPTADLNELINGGYGLRVACDLYDIGKGFRSPYLFHESQLHRILR